MGYKQPRSYALMLDANSINLADSTTYYAGIPGYTPATSSLRKVYIPKSGFIRGAIIELWSTAVTGSNENIVVSLRKNDTTSYAVSTIGSTDSRRIFTNYNLNIPVTQGDFIEVLIETPAWVTNPEGTILKGSMFIECE